MGENWGKKAINKRIVFTKFSTLEGQAHLTPTTLAVQLEAVSQMLTTLKSTKQRPSNLHKVPPDTPE